MTTDAARAEFWEAELAEFARTRVGPIDPYLARGVDSDTARSEWFAAIDAVLAELPPGVFERFDGSTGEPRLLFRGGVALLTILYRLEQRAPAEDAWWVIVRPDAAPIIVDAVGAARWPGTWEAELAALGTPSARVLPGGERSDLAEFERRVSDELVAAGRAPGDVFTYVALTRGPNPWFTDPTRAARAARAVGAGIDAVAELYARLEGSET